MNIKASTKEEKQETNKQKLTSYSHIVCCVKINQNLSSSQYADTMSTISFSFLKYFIYFPLRGLFKINFKLRCISTFAYLKFSISLVASFTFLSSSIQNLGRDGWIFSWILLFSFGFCFLFLLSFFLFCSVRLLLWLQR